MFRQPMELLGSQTCGQACLGIGGGGVLAYQKKQRRGGYTSSNAWDICDNGGPNYLREILELECKV